MILEPHYEVNREWVSIINYQQTSNAFGEKILFYSDLMEKNIKYYIWTQIYFIVKY